MDDSLVKCATGGAQIRQFKHYYVKYVNENPLVYLIIFVFIQSKPTSYPTPSVFGVYAKQDEFDYT